VLKKFLMLCLIVLFVASFARAGTVIYGAGNVLFSDGVGGGTMLGVGQQLSERVILLGSYGASKTNAGLSADNGFVGVIVLTDVLIPKLRSGLFLMAELGGTKIEGEDLQLGNLANAGFYFNLSETSKLFLGGCYSAAEEGATNVYSAQAGLCMDLPWTGAK